MANTLNCSALLAAYNPTVPRRSKMEVTARTMVTSIRVFKAIAGQETVFEYNKDCLDRQQSSQRQDWSALYTQLQADHILGTLPYRWDAGHTEALLCELQFQQPISICILEGSVFHNNEISGEDKAKLIKSCLLLDESMPLMEAFSKREQVVAIRETENEWEIVIPHNLLPRLQYSERVVGKFRRHLVMPITSKWAPFDSDKPEKDLCWEECEDGKILESLVSIFPSVGTLEGLMADNSRSVL